MAALRRSLMPGGSAAAENSSAKTSSLEGFDSGYGSTGNTTDGSTTDHSQDFADGVALPSRRIFERRVTKLRLFDREIPQLTQHRFHDLHELYERPLYNHLTEAKISPHPISIKLKVLGESETTAKPWIVILCSKAASKRVRHFFNQQHIKADYQPSNPDSFLPSFEIFVCHRPPRPMAGIKIYGDLDQRSTMCGSRVRIGEGDRARFATLGGVIKAIKPSGTVMFYGMTAGHVLLEEPSKRSSSDQADIPNEEDDEDEGFYSGEEEYELDDILDGFDEGQDFATIDNRTGTVPQNTQLGLQWPMIGSVSATSNKGAKTEHDLDWALIDLDKVADYRPNLLVTLNRENTAARHRPLKENGKATEDGSSRKVLLLSGTDGVKSGMLSTSLSFLMMGPGKAFTKTYTLVLPQNSVLNAGDCGSWVVDESTCEVYGHVVASDAMGDTYVVPLNATLRDMEEKLAAAVVLPTEADVHTWLAQHAKAAEQSAVLTASRKKKVESNDSKTERVELPRDRQKLVGQSSPRASASLVLPAVKAPIPIVDYCNLCDAKFEGGSQDVRSSLLRHRQSCSKQIKSSTSGIEGPISQSAKDSLDESSKSSSVKHDRNVQQKATSQISTQQPSPVPWSIRSMYSNFKKPSSYTPLQKDKGKAKNGGGSVEEKVAGSASSTKVVATTPSISAAKHSKKTTKDSNLREEWSSPPFSKNLPNPLPALAGNISGVLSPEPISSPRPSSLPTATPSSLHVRQDGKSLAASSRRPASPPVDGHKSSHQSSSDPRHQSHTTQSEEVSYEGYTFTRCKPHHTGQKETWAIAQMVPMPVSQRDLKDQIKKNRKKHVSALDEYNDDRMKGFKRKQVDNLIRECTKIDGDYGYEYVLASIKLDSRKTKSKTTETLSMQVILKRQLMAGFLHENSAEGSLDVHAKLPSQVMDLTREDELGMLREHGTGSQDVGHWSANIPSASHPEHGAFPLSPGPDQFIGHIVPFVDNRPSTFQAAPPPPGPMYFATQGMRQLPHPPPPLPPPPPPLHLPVIHQEIYSDRSRLREPNISTHTKASEIPYNGQKSWAEHEFASISSSLSDHSIGPYSDNSWAKTDATPASTVESSQSYESRNEESMHKESKGGSHNKGKAIPSPLSHEIDRTVYRERRGTVHRRSSLSPVRMTMDLSSHRLDPDFDRHERRAAYQRTSSGANHRDFEHYDIEPAVSFPADRSSRHRRSSVSPERPSHRRVSSYDLDDPHAHNSRALIPVYRRATVYQDPPRGFPHGIDPHEYAAERRRELERWDREWEQRASEEARKRREIETLERFESLERQERRTEEMKREMRDLVRRREMRRKSVLENMGAAERLRDMERSERGMTGKGPWREPTYDGGPRRRPTIDGGRLPWYR